MLPQPAATDISREDAKIAKDTDTDTDRDTDSDHS
jgi:hypothetical protein